MINLKVVPRTTEFTGLIPQFQPDCERDVSAGNGCHGETIARPRAAMVDPAQMTLRSKVRHTAGGAGVFLAEKLVGESEARGSLGQLQLALSRKFEPPRGVKLKPHFRNAPAAR